MAADCDHREQSTFSPTFFEEWWASEASAPDAEKGGSDMDVEDLRDELAERR